MEWPPKYHSVADVSAPPVALVSEALAGKPLMGRKFPATHAFFACQHTDGFGWRMDANSRGVEWTPWSLIKVLQPAVETSLWEMILEGHEAEAMLRDARGRTSAPHDWLDAFAVVVPFAARDHWLMDAVVSTTMCGAIFRQGGILPSSLMDLFSHQIPECFGQLLREHEGSDWLVRVF